MRITRAEYPATAARRIIQPEGEGATTSGTATLPVTEQPPLVPVLPETIGEDLKPVAERPEASDSGAIQIDHKILGWFICVKGAVEAHISREQESELQQPTRRQHMQFQLHNGDEILDVYIFGHRSVDEEEPIATQAAVAEETATTAVASPGRTENDEVDLDSAGTDTTTVDR